MSDEEKKPEDLNDDQAHQEKMEELFGDLEDEEETLEDVQLQRDELLKQFAKAAGNLGQANIKASKLDKQFKDHKEETKKSLARAQREFDEEKSFAVEKIIKELLPVVDNFERSLNAISDKDRANDQKFDKMAHGVERTVIQLKSVFSKFGVKEINPLGKEFDENKHEAIGLSDDSNVETDIVVNVAQKGYELNGRVIRAAKVIIKQ